MSARPPTGEVAAAPGGVSAPAPGPGVGPGDGPRPATAPTGDPGRVPAPASAPTGDQEPAPAQASAPTGDPEPASERAAPGPDGGRAPGAASHCTACGEALTTDAHFCEACGAPTGGLDAVLASDVGGGDDDTEDLDLGTAAAGPCDKCGGEVGPDGYCTSCGHRAIEEVTVDDRGPTAVATHRGRRHRRNEDAGGLAFTAEGWPVVVVSDGVSVSPNPHKASAAAVAAAVARLADRPFGGPDDLVLAVRDAHDAASAVPAEGDPHWTTDGTHPACTIVVAVATGQQVHVANVGDARAQLLRPDGDAWVARQLTTDDSVAAQAVAEGIDPAIALNLPGGHGITAWLGADAHGLAAHVSSAAAGPGDVLLVCSDGLWNYAPTDDEMGTLLAGVLPAPGTAVEALGRACEQLVSWAIDQGGADNITVALAPLPAAPGESRAETLEDDE